MDSRLRLIGAAVVMLAVLLWSNFLGCAPAGPPAIVTGTECAACGMPIEDLRFACTRRDIAERKPVWRAYDSIECLARDWHRGATPRDAYAADYDQARLHRADSLWVVKGSFPSPMGGGLASFLDRGAAQGIADQTHGIVMPFDSLLSGAGSARP